MIEQIVTAVLVMVLDITIAVLPMPVLWGLNMPTRKKWGITVLFSLGLMWVSKHRVRILVIRLTAFGRVCGLNIARIVVTFIVNQEDSSYSFTDAAVLGGLEIWVGICIACMPTLQPCWQKLQRVISHSLDFLKGKSSCATSTADVPLRDGIFKRDRFQRLSDDVQDTEAQPTRGKASMVVPATSRDRHDELRADEIGVTRDVVVTV